MGDNAVILNEMAEAAGGGAAGDAAIVNAILDDLDATLPQAPENAATTYALDAVVQNWGAHPFTLGAYSYPKVGTYTTASDNKRADLQVPAANNRIFFAGEGSHETHPSTVVGALHEGERAANEVHAVNGNPNDPPPLPDGNDTSDPDEDGIGNYIDNCPDDYNPLQEDFDGDGVGYACDITCATDMDFVHNFSNGDIFDLQASGSISFAGTIASGTDISFDARRF